MQAQFEPQKSRYSGGNLAVTLIVALLLAYLAWRIISPTAKTDSKPVIKPTALSVTGIATVAATYTSGKHPCSVVNAECGDHATWKEWTDVDRMALSSGAITILDCSRVHKRYDTGAGYDMTDATHTQIAVWFTLSAAERIAFLNSCQK